MIAVIKVAIVAACLAFVPLPSAADYDDRTRCSALIQESEQTATFFLVAASYNVSRTLLMEFSRSLTAHGCVEMAPTAWSFLERFDSRYAAGNEGIVGYVAETVDAFHQIVRDVAQVRTRNTTEDLRGILNGRRLRPQHGLASRRRVLKALAHQHLSSDSRHKKSPRAPPPKQNSPSRASLSTNEATIDQLRFILLEREPFFAALSAIGPEQDTFELFLSQYKIAEATKSAYHLRIESALRDVSSGINDSQGESRHLKEVSHAKKISPTHVSHPILTLSHCELFCSIDAARTHDVISRSLSFLGLSHLTLHEFGLEAGLKASLSVGSGENGFLDVDDFMSLMEVNTVHGGAKSGEHYSTPFSDGPGKCFSAPGGTVAAKYSRLSSWAAQHHEDVGQSFIPFLRASRECEPSCTGHSACAPAQHSTDDEASELEALLPVNSRMSWDGPGILRVAVLVIGEYRTYDGTWPSHQKFVYNIIRSDPSLGRLDVFTCLSGTRLPKDMPEPAAHFNMASSNQTERLSDCYGRVLKASNISYDVFIRSRPDIEIAYPIMWPLPEPGSPLFAEVYAPIIGGKIAAYPWSSDLTGGMFVWGKFLAYTIEHDGEQCPSLEHSLLADANDPCVDITDQIAAVRARVAPHYFENPMARFSSADFDRHHPPHHNDPTIKNFKCTGWWQYFPNEGRLNYRLRRAGASITPWDFGYFLSPSRKFPMAACSNTMKGNLESCLVGEHKQLTREARALRARARSLEVSCILPGEPNKPLPLLVDRWGHSDDPASKSDDADMNTTARKSR